VQRCLPVPDRGFFNSADASQQAAIKNLEEPFLVFPEKNLHRPQRLKHVVLLRASDLAGFQTSAYASVSILAMSTPASSVKLRCGEVKGAMGLHDWRVTVARLIMGLQSSPCASSSRINDWTVGERAC